MKFISFFLLWITYWVFCLRTFHPATSPKYFLLCHSVSKSWPTLLNPKDCSVSGFPVPHHLPEFAKFMSIESVMPSNHLIFYHPLLPSLFPSIRVFSNELAVHNTWKYWSFNFSISPSNEYSGLISLRVDWFDLLAFQETLKSVLPHHSSKASILQQSAFFIVQLSHQYRRGGKNTQKNCTKKIFTTQIIMMVWSLT